MEENENRHFQAFGTFVMFFIIIILFFFFLFFFYFASVLYMYEISFAFLPSLLPESKGFA